MGKTIERACRLSALVIAVALSAMVAAADGRPEADKPVQGVAELSVVADGEEILVELVVPALSVVGFEHPPGTYAERETLRLAKENLHTGDGLVRFNTQAGCRLEAARADAGLGSESGEAEGHKKMVASYRFVCDQPDQLRSAAVGLFVGFPALERVLVHYAMRDGRGAAELTRSRPVVSFVPLL